ncbi:MAG: DUF6612 family protein [Candidatus Altiarchaeota archaeon]
MEKAVTALTIALILFVSGCEKKSDAPSEPVLNESGLNLGELQRSMIDANSRVRYYKLRMNIKINSTTESGGAYQFMRSRSSSTAEVDVKGKKMIMSQSVEAYSGDVYQEVDMEVYVYGGYMYFKTGDVWFKTEFDDRVWDVEDQVKQNSRLLENSEVRIKEEKIIDGRPYYVLEVMPDEKELVRLSLERQNMTHIIDEAMDYDDMVKHYSLEFWVNKETHVVERELISMRIQLTPENMRVKDPDTGDMRMDTIMNADVEIYDIDDIVYINLPADAAHAPTLEGIRERIEDAEEK